MDGTTVAPLAPAAAAPPLGGLPPAPPVAPLSPLRPASPPLGPVTPGSSVPGPPPRGDEDVSPEEFLNRDLSWLEFNRRVLHEAVDDRTPLLERVRFLGIFTSNLDEYFMKRLGGLRRQIEAKVVTPTSDGLTPQQTLTAIRNAVLPMLAQQADCFVSKIRPALAENGIHLLNWSDLTDGERAAAERYFQANIFPVLTPLAVDPGNPFPIIS